VSGRTLALLAAAVACEVAAFPPIGAWPLALLLLAPLAAHADGARPRDAFAFAWLQQALGAAAIGHWLPRALVVEYGVAPAAAGAFQALLIGAYALLPAAALGLYARLRPRLSAGAAPLACAALFVLAEWLRAEPLGLPWLLLAQPLARAPWLLQTAELGGAYGPGLAAAATGAGIGIALRRRRAAALAGPAALLALSLGFAALRMGAVFDAGPEIRVGVVQASVPIRERFVPGSALRNTLHHVELTRALAARGRLDLTVWSETAVDDDLDLHPELAERLRALAAELGAPLVTGAPRSRHGRPTNAVVLVGPEGLRGSYDKQVLVPFAEADPSFLAFLAPLVGPVASGTPYAAGRESAVLPGPVPFSAPVCFEITYPALVRRFRAAGARLLVNLSNDAWFGPTGYAELHLSHAVLRAVELRTWVVRGTNTGISALVDPAGRVRERLGLFEEGSFAAPLRAAATETLYARFGNAPVLALLAALVLAAPLTGRGRARRRRA
jgi:apolipoprotein N-acyltransferase